MLGAAPSAPAAAHRVLRSFLSAGLAFVFQDQAWEAGALVSEGLPRRWGRHRGPRGVRGWNLAPGSLASWGDTHAPWLPGLGALGAEGLEGIWVLWASPAPSTGRTCVQASRQGHELFRLAQVTCVPQGCVNVGG